MSLFASHCLQISDGLLRLVLVPGGNVDLCIVGEQDLGSSRGLGRAKHRINNDRTHLGSFLSDTSVRPSDDHHFTREVWDVIDGKLCFGRKGLNVYGLYQTHGAEVGQNRI